MPRRRIPAEAGTGGPAAAAAIGGDEDGGENAFADDDGYAAMGGVTDRVKVIATLLAMTSSHIPG